MSAEGYEKHAPELKDDGMLVYEKDLVRPNPQAGQKAFGVSSTSSPRNRAARIVQNIVMVGFFAGATKIVPREAMREAVRPRFQREPKR